jgi:hypothetical protein
MATTTTDTTNPAWATLKRKSHSRGCACCDKVTGTLTDLSFFLFSSSWPLGRIMNSN